MRITVLSSHVNLRITNTKNEFLSVVKIDDRESQLLCNSVGIGLSVTIIDLS